MKKQPKSERESESNLDREKKSEMTKLPRMEMYVVLGLELSQRILAKLEALEDSVDMLARQKARHLQPKPPKPKQ